MKFRADVDGRVTGLRFYKGSGNTGTHVGHLWTRTGTLLATATFTNESATGWQQVNLSTPVSITANTTYVASYHAPNGRYAVNEDYFGPTGVDSPPLHALRDGVDGGNGVYGYGPSGTFPTGVYRTENYWVDVVFDTGSGGGGGDTTPPTVPSTSPASGATGTGINANVTATFNEPMSAASITTTNVQLRDPGGAVVPATVTYDARDHHGDARPRRRARELHDLHRDRPRRRERRQGHRRQRPRRRQDVDASRPRRRRARAVRAASGHRRRRPRSPPRPQTTPRSRSGSSSARRPTGGSRGCASTRAPPIREPTSATSGAAPARCSPPRRSPTRPHLAGSR